MVIRSLQEQGYYERRRGGLPGAGVNWKENRSDTAGTKSFSEYLTEAFEGEVVQRGSWTSETLSELTRKNLKKI